MIYKARLMKRKIMLTLASLVLITVYTYAAVVYSTPLKGKELDMGNLLQWETSYETNTDIFIVEKSTDGITFKNIGSIDASGDTNDEKSYRYLDTSLGMTKSYYRLKVLDQDGTSNYSQVTIINKLNSNNFAVVAYSSALAEKSFDITVDALGEGQLELELVSYQGELVYNDFQFLYPGLNELSVSLEDATEGVYKVKLRVGEEEEVLVIQKASDELSKKVNMASTKKIGRH